MTHTIQWTFPAILSDTSKWVKVTHKCNTGNKYAALEQFKAQQAELNNPVRGADMSQAYSHYINSNGTLSDW